LKISVSVGPGLKFLAHDPRHRPQTGLGGCVGHVSGHRRYRSDRAGDDDGAAIAHQRQGLLDGEERAAQIDGVDLIPELRSDIGHHRKTAHSGVHEQHIDTAQGLLGVVQGAFGVVQDRHVGTDA